jgi:hypothetical protein
MATCFAEEERSKAEEQRIKGAKEQRILQSTNGTNER